MTYLWNPFRVHKRPSFDSIQTSNSESIDKLYLGFWWNASLLILQTISWSDFYYSDSLSTE